MNIGVQRLRNQKISGARLETPGEVVRRLGAVQAQDYLGALWAVGLRTPSANEAAVERALAERVILRTWPMRGTLHFTAAEDARWLLDLLAPRVIVSSARRLRDQYGIDAELLARTRRIWEAALLGGRALTRAGMYAALAAAGIAVGEQRGLQLLWRLAQEGLICFGVRAGKQPTFVLLEEWAPAGRRPAREEALTELARRYFTSRGPATTADFAWWSGLNLTEAKAGLEAVKDELVTETIEGQAYWFSTAQQDPRAVPPAPAVCLLPPYDEFTVAYKERGALLPDEFAPQLDARTGLLGANLVIDGQVVGVWKRSLERGKVAVAVRPFRALSEAEQHALQAAAARYGEFLGLEVEMS